MTAKEAFEIILGNENSSYPDYEEAKDTVKSALNRLEELEKVLRENLFYSNCCLDYSGKTYIDFRVEDDNPDFNLLKEYLR